MTMPFLEELGDDPLPADVASLADELAVASIGEVGLADRLRGWTGSVVTVLVGERQVQGIVVACHTDAVLLADTGSDWLLPLTGIDGVVTPSEHRSRVDPAGRDRTSGLRALADWIGDPVLVVTASGREVSGRVQSPGADHLVVAGPVGSTLIPWRSTLLVRR